MDLDILLACYDCPHIVQCYGYFIKDTEVWICMELMATCFDKMLKKFKQPIPERILGKISVAVSQWAYRQIYRIAIHNLITSSALFCLLDCQSVELFERQARSDPQRYQAIQYSNQ